MIVSEETARRIADSLDELKAILKGMGVAQPSASRSASEAPPAALPEWGADYAARTSQGNHDFWLNQLRKREQGGL